MRSPKAPAVGRIPHSAEQIARREYCPIGLHFRTRRPDRYRLFVDVHACGEYATYKDSDRVTSSAGDRDR
jgi:hypothetical protein